MIFVCALICTMKSGPSPTRGPITQLVAPIDFTTPMMWISARGGVNGHTEDLKRSRGRVDCLHRSAQGDLRLFRDDDARRLKRSIGAENRENDIARRDDGMVAMFVGDGCLRRVDIHQPVRERD